MLLTAAVLILLYVALGHWRGCLMTLIVLWAIGYFLAS
jgi:hypothetical protein